MLSIVQSITMQAGCLIRPFVIANDLKSAVLTAAISTMHIYPSHPGGDYCD